MGARLVDADRALRDQLLHVAVVLRQLGQLLLVPQVDAAVADPGDLEAVAGDARGHHGGAHGQRIAALARGADDLLVGDPDRLRQRRALADLAHDRLAGQGAGDLAVLVSPHSRSEEHTSELQSLMRISYAVFCLKKKNKYKYQRE